MISNSMNQGQPVILHGKFDPCGREQAGATGVEHERLPPSRSSLLKPLVGVWSRYLATFLKNSPKISKSWPLHQKARPVHGRAFWCFIWCFTRCFGVEYSALPSWRVAFLACCLPGALTTWRVAVLAG